VPTNFWFPDEIRTYLALTEAQAQKIFEQNSEFTRWSSTRSQRLYEVQSEIVVETARSRLDAAALGVRYAEFEAIRREIVERNTKLIAANVAVLTAAQVLMLKALEEPLKLVATSSLAQYMKLLPDTCGVPTVSIRSGDFILVPTPVIPDPAVGGIGFNVLGGYCVPRGTFIP
jgi:hypothetical protein